MMPTLQGSSNLSAPQPYLQVDPNAIPLQSSNIAPGGDQRGLLPSDPGFTLGATSTIAPGSAGSPQASAYYDTLTGNVNNQLGRLGTQQQVGNQNINDAYNTSFNNLLTGKATADRNYNTSKGNTLQDYTQARGNTQAGVGQQANSLQQLLGAHGSGSSSASEFAAPYAAARQGALQNQQENQIYGRNQQALDTNYGDYNNNYNQSVTGLGHQKDLQTNALQSSIDQNKSGLLAQLANIAQARTGSIAAGKPYEDQINALGGQIDQLGQQYAHPVIQGANPVYQAPSLSSYAVNPQSTPTFNDAPGVGDNISPFLSVLLNQQEKKQGAL